MAVFVQHHDRRFANQKAPVASDAVVESRRLAKQRAIAHRPDNKLVPRRCMPLRAESVAFPELHEKEIRHFPDQREMPRNHKRNQSEAASLPTRHASKRNVECVLKAAPTG